MLPSNLLVQQYYLLPVGTVAGSSPSTCSFWPRVVCYLFDFSFSNSLFTSTSINLKGQMSRPLNDDDDDDDCILFIVLDYAFILFLYFLFRANLYVSRFTREK